MDPDEEHPDGDGTPARPRSELPSDEALASRLENLLDVVTSLAELDFSKRAEIHGDGAFLDGIAWGLNVLSEELRASTVSRDYYDGIIRSMAEGLLVVDAHDTITDVNPASSALLGYSKAQLTGMPWARICPSSWEELLGEQARAERRVETELVCADGRRVEVTLSGSILRRPGGIDGWMYVVQDITGHKELARTLAKARDAALHSAQVTASFLANMSHEIRTPLNGVIGMAWLLLEDDRNGTRGVDAATRAKVEAIHDCATLLLDIVNDILDLSKLESGAAELHLEELDLAHTIENLLHVYALRAEQKGIELVPDLAPVLTMRVRGDAGRLRQVLGNLVSNAIKFTDRGEVVVEVRPVERPACAKGAGGTRLRFEVTDTGIGIAEHLRATIFEAFTQAETTIARKYGGTGLGLTICERLVTLMGGDIGCTSELGRGSTFWFELPLERVASEEAEADPEPLAGQEVLVVDDDARLRRALARAIAQWGGVPLLASDGAEAAAMLRGSGARPRLAIVEWEPSSKRELLEQLAALTGGTMRIVLSTLLSSTDAVIDASLPGVVAAVPKPPKLSRLRSLLRCGAATPGPEPVRAPREVAGPRAGTPLLVVEDNPVNQAVILGQLRRLGLAAQVVDDGRKAVEAVASRRFALVLMDLYLPVMDGYEATEQIRRQSHAAELPIIAVTANATEQVRSRCLAVGMDDFLSKPLRIGHLSKCLSRWLSRGFDGSDTTELDVPAALPVAGRSHASSREADDAAPDACPFAADARVLVVDDEPINRRVLLGMLERLRIATDEATSCEQALAAAAARSYDAVLMDVEMPGSNGLETTRRIRAMESGRRTPILAVTAHDSPYERDRCMAADMDDFVTKPVRMGEIVTRLALWLGPAPRPGDRSLLERFTNGDSVRTTAFAPLAELARTPALCADIREHFLRACRARLERLRRAAPILEGSDPEQDARATCHVVSGWRRDVFALVTWLTNLGSLPLAGLAAALGGSRPEERAVLLNLLDRELSALALS